MKWLIYIVVFPSFFGLSQEILTLENCVNNVLNNEALFIEQSVALETAMINKKFHQWSILPTISASTNLSTSFGRRIDPFTNTFTASQVNSQSIGLSSNMPLFNGFNYFYQKQIFESKVAQQTISVEQKKNELLLSTIDEYVELCNLQTQLDLSKLRIEHYQAIQKKQQSLIMEGKISVIDTLKSSNSILNEKLQLTKFEAQFILKLIRLNFKMKQPTTKSYNFEVESIKLCAVTPLYSEDFQLRMLEAKQKTVEHELKSAHTQNLPSLALSGNIGTGFSTNNKDFTLTDTPTKPYQDQLNQNLYEGVGIYLNIPIFNRGIWFKENKLAKVKLNEIEQSKELSTSKLALVKLENEQQLLSKGAEIVTLNEMVKNLETIYSKTNLLYQEEKTSYLELETSFLEWQTKKVELEFLKLECYKLKLVT